MVRIEKVRNILGYVNGAQQVVADLQGSTAADLPAAGDIVDGCVIMPGSIAQIIQTGQWATLDDDGKWYADGEEVSTEQASTLNASQLSLGKTVVKPSVVVPESFEPDELENEQTAEPEGGEDDAELL